MKLLLLPLAAFLPLSYAAPQHNHGSPSVPSGSGAANSGKAACTPNASEKYNLAHHHDINTGSVIIGNQVVKGFGKLPGASGCIPTWAGGSYDDSSTFPGGKYPGWLTAANGKYMKIIEVPTAVRALRRHNPSNVPAEKRHNPSNIPSAVEKRHNPSNVPTAVEKRHNPSMVPDVHRRHNPSNAPTPLNRRHNPSAIPATGAKPEQKHRRQVPASPKPSIINVGAIPAAPAAGSEMSWEDAIHGVLGMGQGNGPAKAPKAAAA
jgi:hypothetical protein